MQNDKLIHILYQLSSQIEENPICIDDRGLFGGTAGMSILCSHLQQKSILRNIENIIQIQAKHLLEELTTFKLDSLCNGAAGICWALRLLHSDGFIESSNIDGCLINIDKVILSCFIARCYRNELDYLHGGLGLAHYLLYYDIKPKYVANYLGMIVNNSLNQDVAIVFDTFVSPYECKKTYNYGMAHGMASVISVLSEAVEKTGDFECKVALEKLCLHYSQIYQQWLGESHISSFPAWILCDFSDSPDSKLGWCYGDVGISIALIRAAKVLKDENLYNIGIETAIKTTRRKSPEQEWCFCHGSSGLMFIYKFLYEQTHRDEFKIASDYWADILSSIDVTQLIKENKYGILQGTSGICLAIFYYVYGGFPTWQHSLLIEI